MTADRLPLLPLRAGGFGLGGGVRGRRACSATCSWRSSSTCCWRCRPAGCARASSAGFVVATYVFFSVPSRAFLLFDASSCEGCPSNVVASEQTQALAGDVDRAINVAGTDHLRRRPRTCSARHWQRVQRRWSDAAIRPVFITGTVILARALRGRAGRDLRRRRVREVRPTTRPRRRSSPSPTCSSSAWPGGASAAARRSASWSRGSGALPEAGRRPRGARRARSGTRSLELAYWLQDAGRYADAGGRPMQLPEPGSGRRLHRRSSSTAAPSRR